MLFIYSFFLRCPLGENIQQTNLFCGSGTHRSWTYLVSYSQNRSQQKFVTSCRTYKEPSRRIRHRRAATLSTSTFPSFFLLHLLLLHFSLIYYSLQPTKQNPLQEHDASSRRFSDLPQQGTPMVPILDRYNLDTSRARAVGEIQQHPRDRS